MADIAKEVLRVNIEDEVRQSYLDYAMSVIVGRALPDVRDGLKPVHRRIFYAMHEANNAWNRPYVKCARIVGDVMGKYHPHGDSAIYDALVRMAQDFSMRYPLVDGQGNFGSIDGDNAAAMRYTECRLDKLAAELLADIDKETVDFQPNYDEKEQEPTVLPSRLPNLLVNGSAGIAVGMATNIPPHNVNEIIDATLALIDNPELTIDELMTIVPGPDFPTGGIVNGIAGVVEAFKTGRGRILVRAKCEIESDGDGREAIIVTELPYQVNKARLIEKIAELVKDKRIEGIGPDLRDESDKDGLRIYIPIKRGDSAEVVLNNLFQLTPLETVFGINMVALVEGQPRTLSLKEVLEAFVRHRRDVVTRRTIFELRKARARAHILEGLTVALANIDPMIELIKTSPTPDEARQRLTGRRWEPGLVRALLGEAGAAASRPEELLPEYGLRADGDGYQLSEVQAREILEMRLQKLTGLEQEKLTDEFREILVTIRGLIEILEDPARLLDVIRGELAELKEGFGDTRRTLIQRTQEDLSIEDLIAPEDLVVTLSHSGYAKAQPVAMYRAQRRGGKGRSATAIKEEDFVERILVAHSHDTILCFTSAGRVFWLKTFQFPQAGPNSRGRPIVNLLPSLQGDEKVNAMLPVKEYREDRYVFFATKNGVVKKTPLSDFSRPRTVGIWAIELDQGDRLVDVSLTDGSRDVLLFASNGKAVRFAEDEVRPMGRTARGVRGITLTDEARVVTMIVADVGDILTATERGYGKRTPLDEYPRKGRGTQGVIAIQTSERNGELVGATQVTPEHEIMLISNQGTLVRTRAAEVAQVGRNTQGVTLIRLPSEEKLVGVERVAAIGDAVGEGDLGIDVGEGARIEPPAGEPPPEG
jgi:DNA gyrase subunit A